MNRVLSRWVLAAATLTLLAVAPVFAQDQAKARLAKWSELLKKRLKMSAGVQAAASGKITFFQNDGNKWELRFDEWDCTDYQGLPRPDSWYFECYNEKGKARYIFLEHTSAISVEP